MIAVRIRYLPSLHERDAQRGGVVAREARARVCAAAPLTSL